MHIDLGKLNVRELLSIYTASIEELRARGVVRTRNNPLGDYTEWLAASALGLTLSTNSVAGYDAIDSSGVRYQIKGRRVTSRNPSRQLSAIRNLQANDFDKLIAVVFDESFELLDAVEIPHAVVGEYGSYRSHVNAHVLHVRGKLLDDQRVLSVKSQLSAVHKGSSK